MLIRDLEQKTGLDRATIRFYEKEGLISPLRKENGYREYAEADLEHLKKIRLLRQLGISLETIKGLQKGTADFSAALSSQIRLLEQQIHSAESAKDVCTAIFRANTSYSELDAEYYLRQLNRQEQSPSKPQQQQLQTFCEPVRRPYHPVRRFLARMTDYSLAEILILFLIVVVLRVRPFSSFLSNVISFVIPFLMIPISAKMLHWWGTTPGKWLFGLSVYTENGDTLSYYEALEREKLILKEGYGYGIPFWSLYRMYKSYMYYGDVDLDWDRETEYQYHKWSIKRIFTLAAVIVLLVGMSLWTATDSISPKYKGELSIEHFSENYNFYVDLLDEDASKNSKLQKDGTFHQSASNILVIETTGTRLSGDENFGYTFSNGFLHKIHYESSWSDIFAFSPRRRSCITAAITALMSQKGTDFHDLLKFAELLDRADYTKDGTVEYENIEMSWNVVKENCLVMSNSLFLTDDEAQSSFVSVTYDIVIHSK